MALETGHFRMGLTVTLPSINIKGYGSVTREQIWNNEISASTSVDSYYKQENTPSVYKSPLSVSLGFEYFTENTVIAIGAEWFQSVSNYSILSPPYRRVVYPIVKGGYDGLKDSLNFINVYAHNNQVINYSIAIEQKIGAKWKFLTSFYTDMNYAKDDGFKNYSVYDAKISRMIINQSSWDIFHNTMGFTYIKAHSMITFGVDFQYGSVKGQSQIANLNLEAIKAGTAPNGAGADYGLFATQSLTNNIAYQSLNMILGFTHFIHREKTEEKKE